jgi:hypothetical protein
MNGAVRKSGQVSFAIIEAPQGPQGPQAMQAVREHQAPSRSRRQSRLRAAVVSLRRCAPTPMMEFRNQILETLEIVSEAGALAAMARGPQGRLGWNTAGPVRSQYRPGVKVTKE